MLAAVHSHCRRLTFCVLRPTLDVIGVGYVQAACERVFNSNEFSCTSGALWVGTGVV